MLSSITLTYSRYGQPPTFSAPRRDQSEQRGAALPSIKFVAAPVRPDQGQELVQMRELVDRLNSRLNPASQDVQFRLEEKKNQNRILMTESGKVISSFGRGDLDQLEGQLHEMAGFRLSVVT